MTAPWGAGAEADSGVGGGGGGVYIRLFLLVFLLFSCVISLNTQFSTRIFICQRGLRVPGGELRHLAGSPGAGGGIRPCYTRRRVHTVSIKETNRDISTMNTSVVDKLDVPQPVGLTNLIS